MLQIFACGICIYYFVKECNEIIIVNQHIIGKSPNIDPAQGGGNMYVLYIYMSICESKCFLSHLLQFAFFRRCNGRVNNHLTTK